MPIYAYRCSSCGFAKDVLQKVSDAALTECPECHQSTFSKQLTAAGFQLKGTGWYVTDFRDGPKKPASVPASPAVAADAGKSESSSSSSGSSSAATAAPASSSGDTA